MTEPAEEFPCGNCSHDTGSDAMTFCSQACQDKWTWHMMNNGDESNAPPYYWVPQYDMTWWRGVQ